MPSSTLAAVDLIRSDGKPMPGLVSVRIIPRDLPIDQRVAVEDAAMFKRDDDGLIDYVFLRIFGDGRSAHVAAYVVDNPDERLGQDQLAHLHADLWRNGATPLLYVARRTQIDILTCARGPDFWKNDTYQYQPCKHIQVASEISTQLDERRRFSAFRLADGTFWEDHRNAELVRHDKAAHQSLIQAIVETDNELEGHKYPVQRRLLLLVILIKYLEDRDVFPSGWFGRFQKGAKTFFDVLKHGEPEEVERLLKFLEKEKFNGDVFTLPTDDNNQLTHKQLRQFAELVEAKTLNKQRYLWDLHTFEHLPVEVISHLYQRFVQGGHGKVYTPAFLASLLLDHAMPYGKLCGTERVLDPACGSGVFLVGAFRRLVNVWRSRHEWQKPSVADLKEILRNSIFGVEMDPGAIALAAFSLALGVCDALKPDVIWNELRLDKLKGVNLCEADFFQLILDSHENKPTILGDGFDLILGNPPFELSLTAAGANLNTECEKKRGRLPDDQTAYFFLEQGISCLRDKGQLCLIQPSGILYNQNATEFRQKLFARTSVETVFDFTSIRKLYAKDPKTVALLIRGEAPESDHVVEHLTFRRTLSVHERLAFELDHYDRHLVPQFVAESDAFVWRCNLLGGGRLCEISQRLRKIKRTLAKFIEAQPDWDYGEGFIAGKKGKREPAPFLTNSPLLPTQAFTKKGIDESKITRVKETLFKSYYSETRFTAPLILIKAHESLPIAFRENGFLAFRDKIVSIHAPETDVQILRKLFEELMSRRDFYRFCCTVNGSQSLVGKATAILKQDIDILPYPENADALAMSFWEDALKEDVLTYMAEFVKRGQNSVLLTKDAKKTNLDAYSSLFCKMLGTIYKNLHSCPHIRLEGLICQPFYFGDEPSLAWLKAADTAALQNLIYHQEHESLRTIRVLRYYDENVLLIVKPDRLRYWIRSTAIRDADDTLIDLRELGY